MLLGLLPALLAVGAVAVVLIASQGGEDAELDELVEQAGPPDGLGELFEPRQDSLSTPLSPPLNTAGWRSDFSNRSVPLSEFRSGGPPKDGIPAIDHPHFTSARRVDWLEDREPVIEVTVGGETRAYPIQILMWHEIANDEVGGVPVAVTFCPLCNTAIVFDRRVEGEVLSFGTTGKLRDSDLVMYDRETESWWQQFSGEALVGELTGRELEQLPARMVAWGDFRREHPSAPVLDQKTGFSREYGANPYAGYDSIDSPPLFAVENRDDDRLPPKERVVYVEVGSEAFAVPFAALTKERTIEVETESGTLAVNWEGGVASALDERAIATSRDVGAATVRLEGELVPFSEPFWFAVAALRPEIEIVD